MQKLLTFLLILQFLGSLVFAQSPSYDIFNSTKLHEIRLEFEEENFWEILIGNYESVGLTKSANPNISAQQWYNQVRNSKKLKSGSSINYLKANVTIDGDTINDIGVRLKGFSSYWSSDFKKSMKIDFNEFVDSIEYKGIKKINLINGVGDPSFQRDFISYYLMRKAGVAAPRVAYAEVYLNNKYWGLYTLVEQIDKTFLENNFASGEGNLFKTIGWTELEYIGEKFSDYNESIELKTNEETSDGSDYVNFVKSLNSLNGTEFTDSIQKLFYIDYYFKVLAIDVISKNWDSYMEHGRNFYLYHEPVSDLFYWIPWDYNLAWDGDFNWFNEEVELCDSLFSFGYDTVGTNVAYQVTFSKSNDLQVDINDQYEYYKYFSFYENSENIEVTDSNVIIRDTIKYDDFGKFVIIVSAFVNDQCYINKLETVLTMDSSDVSCNAIYDMDRYIKSDVVYDEIFMRDKHCCNCNWDRICEQMYRSYPITNINSAQFRIDINSNKILIKKIFNSNNYKDRYFDAFKYILDSVFDDDEIQKIIIQNTDLIRNSVYKDTNLIFSIEEFENDLDSYCEKSYHITSLTRLIDNRKRGLDVEFDALNYDANSLDQVLETGDVVINEFLANRGNESVFKSDWIELYNNTKDIIKLDGTWLSDNRDSLKYRINGNTVIKPDGFVIVWADNEVKKDGLHAGFKLSANGEDVLLYHEKFDTLDVYSWEQQVEDSSFARFPNGTGPFITMLPTFCTHNIVFYNTGLATNETDETILLYPNPACQNLFIETTTTQNKQIDVYNILGNNVFSAESSNKLTEIDLSGFKSGLFFVKVKQGINSFSNRFVVER